jgi:hypothetical protein
MEEEDKTEDLRVVWVSFLDDNQQQVNGFFKLVEQAQNYIKILSGKNTITVPYHRLLKLKETTIR